jgi:hypothetical protein
VLADGEGIEQRLRRMFVHAVAGIDDARAADARQQMPGTRRGVAQDDHVRGHRFDVQRGVGERFALEDARRRDRHAERVRAQPLFRDFERRAGAGARLVEQVDHGLAAKRRHFLDRPLSDLAHRLGGFQHEMNLVARQIADAQEILLHGNEAPSAPDV